MDAGQDVESTPGAALGHASAAPQQVERRRHPRFACAVYTTVVVADHPPAVCRTVDISKGGLCFEHDETLELKTPVILRLRAAWDGARTDELCIHGRVVWCARTKDGHMQVGVKFDGDMEPRIGRNLILLLDLLAGRFSIASQ